MKKLTMLYRYTKFELLISGKINTDRFKRKPQYKKVFLGKFFVRQSKILKRPVRQ